ncbi:Glucosidase 2 subunit beta, partial [Zancudomyces culisetae]
MRFKISCLSLVLVFAVGSITGKVEGEIKQIRGANPKDAERYVADKDGKFSCFDGKKKIPIAWVNDDYCDCEDGSDEPGTSAYARQVNDGVCEEECCDGSDEWSGLVRCENRCLELAKRDVEKELQKQETEKVGGAVKAQLVDKAKVLIVEKGIEVEKLEAEKQEAEKKFEENQKKKEELEKVENKIIEENKEKGR